MDNSIKSALQELLTWAKKYPVQASLFVLAFMTYPAVFISPVRGWFSEVFLFRLPMELITSGISLTWLILNLNRLQLSKKAAYLIGGFVLFSTASFLITKSHWSDFLQSLNFILMMNCLGASFVEREKRRGGFLFACLIFSLILLVNFIHFIINKSIAGMAGNQNWFAALISACLPFTLFAVYYLINKKLSKSLAAIISSIIILPAYFYCIYHHINHYYYSNY